MLHLDDLLSIASTHPQMYICDNITCVGTEFAQILSSSLFTSLMLFVYHGDSNNTYSWLFVTYLDREIRALNNEISILLVKMYLLYAKHKKHNVFYSYFIES